MNRFSQKVLDELGPYYVYALIDPRNKNIFYIGKGCGNRIFEHCEAAIKDNESSLKLDLIRDIIASGEKVNHYIIRHKLSNTEALKIESVLIDLLTYSEFNTDHVLTNIAAGYHQWDEGIKTTDEINIMYDCKKLDKQSHTCIQNNNCLRPNDRLLLLVCLNKSFDAAKATGIYRRTNEYEKIRKYWDVSKKKAPFIDYVLGVYHGVVRIVLKVEGYEYTRIKKETGELFNSDMCCFHGELDHNSPYLHKDVRDYLYPRWVRTYIKSET